MGRPMEYSAITNLEAMDDEQLSKLVLSNWHKLNKALTAGQTSTILMKLLVLELKKGANARPNIAERIRSSYFRALTKKSANSLGMLLTRLAHNEYDPAVMSEDIVNLFSTDVTLAHMIAEEIQQENT